MRAASTEQLSSQPHPEGERKSINSELWHACAGPKVSLPPIGSLVVYFPQGHSEQVAASTQKVVDGQIPNYPNLPSQLICQLHNVTLHADVETDEVFSQMTLQPITGQEKDTFFAPDIGTPNRQPSDFFCKTLTASDTSTHGGFSVPRRAAEKVFPPLDFAKQPPAQELQARDLHDQIWTFRHIYRGQPKRHLLTTGWSVFVSAKRLVAGDSVLFIRDEKGQLLLGIRRANRQQIVMPSSVLSSDSMHIGVLAAAAHAAATSSRFIVFYNPRASPSEFVISLTKYNKAVYGTRVSVGTRFRMVFETEESTLRRYMGTITGISDLDAVRWLNSQWRNLEVGWDESSAGDRPCRVSVWEIEPASTPFLICPPAFTLRPKRPRHPGDDNDIDGNLQRCLTWLQGDNSNDGVYLQGLTSDPWMRLQQKREASTAMSQPDLYHAMAAAALKEFRSTDASKQQLQHQQPQQMQFRLPQQQSQQPERQQEHLSWSQHAHQQLFQKQQPQQQSPSLTQPQQQLQVSAPQQKLQGPAQTPSISLQQFQAPLFSQHLQPPFTEHDISLPPQQQAVPMPDVPAQLLNRSQPNVNVPFSMRMQTPFSQADKPTAAISNPFLLQSILEKPQLMEDSYQLSTLFKPSSNNMQLLQPEQGSLLRTSTLPREMQVTGTWLPSTRDPIHTESLSTVTNIQQLSQPDGPSAITCSFPVPCEPIVQTGLASLPLQSTSNVFQESSARQENLSDPWNHHLFEVNGDSFSSRSFDLGKDMHACGIHNNAISGPFSASPVSLPSPSVTDISRNNGLMINGGLDEALTSRGCSWPQMAAPVRTFTKVQRLGSFGRSLDVSRFKNYDELRSELARMFNLEGQLEDQRSGWQLVFVDNDGDVLLVGDDPWEEFVGCVRIIRILSPSEVQQMSHDGFDLISIPMQQQTSSSSEGCHPWKDSRDP